MVMIPGSSLLPLHMLLLLLAALHSLANFPGIRANANNSSSSSSSPLCTAESFVCADQGNCIPAEWVGDGEPDCEDGSDEGGRGEAGSKNNTGIGTSTTAVEADPFSMASSAPAKSLQDWLLQLEEQLPQFFDRPLQSGRLLLQGCALLSGQPWSRLQMFLCELLGPALRDQPDCLSANARCPPPSLPSPQAPGNSSSLACALLLQSSAHFLCLEAQSSSECSESALEMLAPLRQESEHWANQLDCPAVREEGEELEQDSVPEAWDALSLLAQVGRLCQIDRREKEPAESIWTKVCDRADVLASNGDCLAEVAEKEGKKCGQKPSQRNSTCAILESFGRNLDCALHTLNKICPVEAQEAVTAIQEQLNDEAIALQCFQREEEEGRGQANANANANTSAQSQFALRPEHGRCSADQEENALLCLAELADLPGRLQRLSSLAALLSNQSALGPVCAIFERYDGCLHSRVFGPSQGGRCALNSPLNALARVGLSPICAHSRALSNQSSPVCFASPALAQCQGPVEALGRAVGAILQGGSNGPAQLCKAFYSLREAFRCGQRASERECRDEPVVLAQLDELLAMLDSIGREEGCPEEAPANLDLLLLLPSRPPSVPQARVLPAPAPSAVCAPAQQDRFQGCIQPLSAFQPHPLAVIKQPRLIAQACQAFANFSLCQEGLASECIPLWARGMAGMFEFACGQGNALFLETRQCLRRVTGQSQVRECVLAFSQASPQAACPSSGQLLGCALPQIEDKCGTKAGQFVRDYVGHFAAALDPNCSLGPVEVRPRKESSTISLGPNCTEGHSQLVQSCSAPLGQFRARLEGLFQGGLQSLLKNLEGLSSVFQQGCSLSLQFRQCLGPLLSSPGECIVSSCLLAAGTGICDQPDVNAAIDSNLGCVFRQVSNPGFGQCIRANLGPLRQLDLSALRSALPQFISCVQPIVLQQCGPVPLNLLRVLALKSGECPLNGPTSEGLPSSPPAHCTPALRQTRLECQNRLLLSKYQFVPGSLLKHSNTTDGFPLEAFCADLEEVGKCEGQTRPCEAEEPYGRARAMHALGTAICSSRTEFGQKGPCIGRAASHSEGGEACLALFEGANTQMAAEDFCRAVNESSQCLAPLIFADCGPEAVDLVFSASNEYLAQMVPGAKCRLEAPAFSLQTGCSERQLVAYLECESSLDRFRPRPIALIGNQSRWDEFCATVQSEFGPCVQKLECRPEPATGASLALYEAVCEREFFRRDQRQFGPCLLNVTESEAARICLDQFRAVDLLAKQSGPKVCVAVNKLLQCTGKMVHGQCGEEALLHLFELYNGWASSFHSECLLSPPDLGQPVKKPAEVEFSSDQSPSTKKGEEGEGEGVEWAGAGTVLGTSTEGAKASSGGGPGEEASAGLAQNQSTSTPAPAHQKETKAEMPTGPRANGAVPQAVAHLTWGLAWSLLLVLASIH